MNVGIVGSREGFDLERVRDFTAKLRGKHPDATVISGGAAGVDTTAESCWAINGGKVISYRPTNVGGGMKEDDWQIECWHLGPDPMFYRMTEEPSFADFASAAIYRDMLIAEAADRLVAFRYARSRGTTATIDFAKMLGKPVHVYDEGAQGGTFQE